MHVLTRHSLTKIPNTTQTIDTTFGSVDIDMYFDNRYSNMAPIFCFVVDIDENEACVVKIDNAYALPIMNHYGVYDFDTQAFPTKCDWYVTAFCLRMSCLHYYTFIFAPAVVPVVMV